MAQQRRRQKGTGSVRAKGRGWESLITVNGAAVRKYWDHEPADAELLQWCVAERLAQRAAPSAGSFEADVAEYLTRIAAMPTRDQVAYHLNLWLDALGRTRARSTITPAEIDAVMQGWLSTPIIVPPGQKNGPRPRSASGLLTVSSVAKRRAHLRAMFYRLDGKHAPNPVRGTALPPTPAPAPKGRPYGLILQILARMAPHRWRKGGPQPSHSLLRAALMAYTGLPPALIKEIQPTDIDWRAGTLLVSARRKGRGVGARLLPLAPQALAALRAFDAAGAYGTFCTAGLNICFRRAARGLDATITLYDLRHSFGEEVYRRTADLPTVGRLLMHSPTSTATARYAMGANAAVNQLAVAAFGTGVAALAEAPAAAPEARPAGYLPDLLATEDNPHHIM